MPVQPRGSPQPVLTGSLPGMRIDLHGAGAAKTIRAKNGGSGVKLGRDLENDDTVYVTSMEIDGLKDMPEWVRIMYLTEAGIVKRSRRNHAIIIGTENISYPDDGKTSSPEATTNICRVQATTNYAETAEEAVQLWIDEVREYGIKELEVAIAVQRMLDADRSVTKCVICEGTGFLQPGPDDVLPIPATKFQESSYPCPSCANPTTDELDQFVENCKRKA